MRFISRVSLVLMCLCVGAAAAWSQAACPVSRPVPKLDAVAIYSEGGRGDRPDQAAEQRNAELRTELTAFLRLLSEAYDTASANPACAEAALAAWAKAGGLLVAPTSASARVERVLAAVALNALAIKARAAGRPPKPAEVAWLTQLTTAVARDYGRDSLRGTPFFRNNVFFWASAAVGLHAVLTRDPGFVAAADQAWRDVIERIGPDGFLETEIGRGRRALVYHQFAFSALLILREARLALRQPISANDEARIGLLAAAIGRGLCDPSELKARAGVADMERPGGWGFRVASVFGLDVIGREWTQCGVPPAGRADLRIGGDLARTRDALRGGTR